MALLANFFIPVFFLLSTFCDCSDDFKSPVVELKGQGKLQGLKYASRKGREYFGFLGIPYGKVPQRFAVSEPAEPWKDVKSVTELPPPCFQEHFLNRKEYLGVEDCLQLTVYTPKLDGKLPVVVWIFPGGFQVLGSMYFEGKYFMDEDVVLITINYRLGAMGFLDTTDGEVGGNMGLKDQNLALKWVKKNVAQFGGNPDLVTVMGMSAGSASANYHLLSPMSKGLIHRGIAQSGSVINPWALQYKPKENFERLAKDAKCNKKTTKEIVECLRALSPVELINAQNAVVKYGKDFDLISMKFVPTIESPKSASPRFIEEHPYKMMKTGNIANKVPLMAGFTQNEGSLYTAMLHEMPESIEMLNKEWDKMAPNIFYYEDMVHPSKQAKVTKAIRRFYFGSDPISNENKEAITDIFSDRLFNNGIAEGIKLMAKHLPVYSYFMNYHGKYSIIQFEFPDYNIKSPNGVSHADELFYMFNCSMGFPEINLGTEHGEFSEKLIKLIASFAKDGIPSEAWGSQKEWKPVEISESTKDEPNLKFYDINLKETRYIDDPFKDRRMFWKSLPLMENEHLFPKDQPKDEF